VSAFYFLRNMHASNEKALQKRAEGECSTVLARVILLSDVSQRTPRVHFLKTSLLLFAG
jgi:hypothetical protein